MPASQVYGSFVKWYILKLKSKPYLINVGTGLVLMSTGDVLAQKVEIGGGAGGTQQQQRQRQQLGSTQLKQQQRIEIEKKEQEQQELKLQQQQHDNNGAGISFQLLQDTTTGGVEVVYQNLCHEISSWDKFRTAKMGAWSLVFTPFYVGVYKMYDRYLPKRTPASIAARVGLSFLCSIPINFSFYAYGNFVQHTADWYKENREAPYRFDQLVEKTQRKLEAELFSTIKTSASFWIPINFLSFSIVPAHIQPLSLMFFSIFWNCYLSMSQHRKVVVPSSSVSTSQQQIIDTNTIGNIVGTKQ
mmetsp:Transcript_29028/g.32561  ORF Transcript_29028/g.32561 Transcript_29028/m.32561 type:complete len:301 (-) Transcript_29028:24-926(-)